MSNTKLEQEQPKTESLKGSVVRDQRWAEVQHCETHDWINDISTLAQEHLPVITIAGVAA